MKSLLIDIETRSEIDIGKCGAFRYIEDDSFEILLFAYSVDEAPAVCIDLTAGETIPSSVIQAIYDPSVLKIAHNAVFERTALAKYFGRYCHPEQWLDTMHLSAHCGLPLALGQLCDALEMSEDQAKMREGKALIRLFCVPQKRPLKKYNGAKWITPDMEPEKWEVFKTYCARDVDTELLVWQTLRRWTPDESERKLWCLDTDINENGVRADMTLANAALQMDSKYKEELTEKAVALTGLENPSSVTQIKEWLLDQEGMEVPSLNKKEVADVVAKLQTDTAKEFMAIRTELAKTSTKKYDAFVRCACKDDHIKGCFQFFGGHTGRWAGRLLQLQNLPQNHMEDLDDARTLVRSGDYEGVKLIYGDVTGTLSELIRTTIIPEEGDRIVVADFSAIEARVAAYLTKTEWRLDVFRNGGDIYCASASQMFKVPVEKHGQNAHLRQKGKVAELALGYGGGVGALKAFGADKLGMKEEEMAETVVKWRKASPQIEKAWTSLQDAMREAIQRHATRVDKVCGVRFRWDDKILWMRLPSGREMAYFDPEYGPSQYNRGKETISYMGINQVTRKWSRIETWGGRIFENLVQAVARDCLKETMLNLADDGWDIIAHVHDEIICSEPINGRSVADMCAAFSKPIPWAPDLPLVGAGYEDKYYRKD